MGQPLTCARSSDEHEFFTAVQAGDLDTVESFLSTEPHMLHRTTVFDRLSALHIAAANGQLEVLSMLLNRSVHPDLLNRHKQTPLMLAAMHDKIACVEMLLHAGANILMFDSLHGRTCLHYAAYYGHSDCLQAILSAANSTPVVDSWGFARFVNVRDGNGATPLHLAARQRRPECVHILLDKGALVCASTGGYGCPGSNPLHLAARSGCLDCVRELLAWGADRLQRDSSGRIPYAVALKQKHGACAALLNPSTAEPLVWPSPLKFISELNPDAKVLLENALMEANREREKNILKGTSYSLPSPAHSDDSVGDDISEASDTELCCICFDQACTIEVQDCGHQMCAHCTLALCCHIKPNPTTLCLLAPACPFCRSSISQLVVAKSKTKEEASDTELCCICFDQVCTIEVQDCGHQMCAQCTLALCCHNKPNPTTLCLPAPACPFCRSSISRLVVAKSKTKEEPDKDTHSFKLRKSRRSRNFGEGSSSFKGLSSAMGSFGKMSGRGSGRIADSSDTVDKP